MRQTPGGGTGDTALRRPSWGAEEQGGSRDVRAIIPNLTPAPVSFGAGGGMGGTEPPWGHPARSCGGPQEQQRGVMGTAPGSGEPVLLWGLQSVPPCPAGIPWRWLPIDWECLNPPLP